MKINGDAVRMIKMVIFDLDGTLIDTEPASIDSWIAAASEAGLQVKREDILTFIGRNPEGIRKRSDELYGPDFPFDYIYRRKKELTGIQFEKKLEAKPHAKEALEILKSLGLKMCVATSSSKERSINFLQKLGLWSYFEYLISGEEVEKSKPDPEIFMTAMKNGGVSPEECIVVEDSFNGITAARRSGAVPVLIPDLVEPGEEWRGLSEKEFPDLLSFSLWVIEKVNGR